MTEKSSFKQIYFSLFYLLPILSFTVCYGTIVFKIRKTRKLREQSYNVNKQSLTNRGLRKQSFANASKILENPKMTDCKSDESKIPENGTNSTENIKISTAESSGFLELTYKTNPDNSFGHSKDPNSKNPASRNQESNDKLTKKFDAAERKVIKRSMTIVTIFILSWTPFYVVRFLKITEQPHISELLSVGTLIIVYLNNALNPILYIFVSEDFQQGCKRAVRLEDGFVFGNFLQCFVKCWFNKVIDEKYFRSAERDQEHNNNTGSRNNSRFNKFSRSSRSSRATVSSRISSMLGSVKSRNSRVSRVSVVGERRLTPYAEDKNNIFK